MSSSPHHKPRVRSSLMSKPAPMMLFVLFTFLSSLVHCSDVDSIQPEDHNHERLASTYLEDDSPGQDFLEETMYEPEFLGSDRAIVGRVAPFIGALVNNRATNMNFNPGDTKYFSFANASVFGAFTPPGMGLPPSRLKVDLAVEEVVPQSPRLEMREASMSATLGRRQTGQRTVYITMTTCLQPSSQDATVPPPPQLELYVSTSDNNQNPGPNQISNQLNTTLNGGFANITVNATGSVYVGVFAPNSTSYTGIYNADIAASIDGPFHQHFEQSPNLYLVDADTSSALFVTNNLTYDTSGTGFEQWMNITPPFEVFASNISNTAIQGLQNSYCALTKTPDVLSSVDNPAVISSMSNITLGPYPKEQIYFRGLRGNSQYYGYLAMNGNSTASGDGVVGGGGAVWQAMIFGTQADGNCAVIFDLPFCSTVAYAVPGNPQNFPNVTNLALWYDDAAQNAYQYFQNVLAQIPCEIEDEGQYSLAVTCDDCSNAYKAWLCSVMIPRCMDYSNPLPWLHERNVLQPFPNGSMLDSTITDPAQNVLYLNSSRNPNIDSVVFPGPYKEILPCDDLCYSLVRSCPASMQFGCPLPGVMGFNHSYGLRPDGSPAQSGQITCNYPGAAYYLSGTGRLARSWGAGAMMVSVTALLLVW